jgi:transcriptional regulator GlxA family with amidase domain
MVSNVAVIALDEIAPFELGVLCEVFGTDRTDEGFPGYTFNLVTPDGGPVTSRSGFAITPTAADVVDDADLVAIPAIHRRPTARGPDALNAARARGHVLSVCPARSSRRGRAARWALHHPLAVCRRAGSPLRRRVFLTAPYMDDAYAHQRRHRRRYRICLHLVRNCRARASRPHWLVAWWCRHIAMAAKLSTSMAPLPAATERQRFTGTLLSWVEHLDQPITVDDLALRSHMASRTFARRFRAEVGTTPHDRLTAQRVLLARRLLKRIDLAIESVASHAGFGDAATLRHLRPNRLGPPRRLPHHLRALDATEGKTANRHASMPNVHATVIYLY